MLLTVGTWNLENGGLDAGNDARLRRQLDLLASRLDVDAWALQEAKDWTKRRLRRVARHLKMNARSLISSNHHDCHLVMLVRERPDLRVVRERHDQAAPFWHALGGLELELDGLELHFLDLHLAPSSKTIRLCEAEVLGLYRNRWTLAAGDFNAVPGTGPLPDIASVSDLDKAHRKLNRRAAQAIQEAKFHDIGAHLGNTTPTVGHTKPGALAYRCDRIESTLPPATYTTYEVLSSDELYVGPDDPELPDQWLSNHRPVIARLTIDPTSLGAAA